MIRETFAVGPLDCNCTVVADEASGDAIVVDGGDGVDRVAALLAERGWRARFLIHTHAHLDHIGDLGRLRETTGAKGLLHPADLPLYAALGEQARWIGLPFAPPVTTVDGELHDGQVVEAGSLRIGVMHTPGHTPGSVCFSLDAAGQTTLITGDTLFAGAIGRWDLGGTSMNDIVASIRRKVLPFPDATLVIPGHGPFTTVGNERAYNPYLAG
ncbi:MAG TPA: MBL fold metallo-hydrolase [Candidatus Tumulicola sp.]